MHLLFAMLLRWNLTTQQFWSVSRLLLQTLRICSKSTSRSVICTSVRQSIWRYINCLEFSEINGGSMFIIMKTDLVWLCLRNEYLRWLSFTRGVQLKRAKGEQKEGKKNTNRDKLFSKTSNFRATSNVKETKQFQSEYCPLADGTFKICNFCTIQEHDWERSVRSSDEATFRLWTKAITQST